MAKHPEVRVTPVNPAEAVFEPFWDPLLSGLAKWKVEDGTRYGLHVKQSWCFVTFEWARKPESGPALRMVRDFGIDCSFYDTLIVSMAAPEGDELEVTVATDKGAVSKRYPPAASLKKEYELSLDGAKRIDAVTLKIFTTVEEPQTGFISWLGLANSKMRAEVDTQWEILRSQPLDVYLKPEDFNPSFTPSYGLLVTAKELEAVRERHAAYTAKNGKPCFTAGGLAKNSNPERLIGEFIIAANPTLFSRERDYGKGFADPAHMAAVAAVIKDRQLLRLAAKTALAMAMCANWDAGFVCFFPGGTWEQRCFTQSAVAHQIALTLDFAGEMLSPAGKEFLLRRLAENGMGSMNFNAWKYDYIYKCNQLAAFSLGRLPAYLALEKEWKHVTPYTELAVRELNESMASIILPDGGFAEGSAYLMYTLGSCLPAYYAYAKVRGKDYREVLPECIQRTANYVEVLMSTDAKFGGLIPVCDGQGRGGPVDTPTAGLLAIALPESQWLNVFRSNLRRNGGQMPDSLITWLIESKLPDRAPPPRPFVTLPEMGVVSSLRDLDGQKVKLFIMGNKAKAGHTHEDKGSFVLEFAGDTFAMDPGGWNYGDVRASLAGHCDRHNMLVPIVSEGERPHPENPLPVDVKPVAEGDATRFHARIDATPGWRGFYKKWVRTWDSPSPAVLKITDEFELEKGDGAAFVWVTQLPLAVNGRQITLTGAAGSAVIEAPADCEIRVDKDLQLRETEKMTRIRIVKKEKAGTITVNIRLSVRPQVK